MECEYNKILAIANRSRVSCAHNTVALPSASVALPMALYNYVYDMIWYDHTRLSGSRVIWRYRDLEMWVRGHSRSLKVVPFASLGAVSYSPSITGCAVAPGLNDDRPSQWEMANFDPSQNRNPWADCNKLLHIWLRPRGDPLNQIGYKSIHWGLLGIWVKYTVFVPFLFIPFFLRLAYRSDR